LDPKTVPQNCHIELVLNCSYFFQAEQEPASSRHRDGKIIAYQPVSLPSSRCKDILALRVSIAWATQPPATVVVSLANSNTETLNVSRPRENRPPSECSALRKPDATSPLPERTQHEEPSQVRVPGIGSYALCQHQRPRRRLGLETAKAATPSSTAAAEAQPRSGSRSQSRNQWTSASRGNVDSCSRETRQAVTNNLNPPLRVYSQGQEPFLHDSLPRLSLFFVDLSQNRIVSSAVSSCFEFRFTLLIRGPLRIPGYEANTDLEAFPIRHPAPARLLPPGSTRRVLKYLKSVPFNPLDSVVRGIFILHDCRDNLSET
jgi:hypothetical protein